MRIGRASVLAASVALAAATLAQGQASHMTPPPSVTAGSAFSIPTTGSGKAALYIVGPGQAVRRDVDLGQPATFAAGVLYNAGHYVVLLTGDAVADTAELDVLPRSAARDPRFSRQALAPARRYTQRNQRCHLYLRRLP